MTGLQQMKVLLRNRETGRYYAGPNEWSAKSSVAHDFEEVQSAIRFVRTQKLSGMEAVLRYDDPTCDLVLPLPEGG